MKRIIVILALAAAVAGCSTANGSLGLGFKGSPFWWERANDQEKYAHAITKCRDNIFSARGNYKKFSSSSECKQNAVAEYAVGLGMHMARSINAGVEIGAAAGKAYAEDVYSSPKPSSNASYGRGNCRCECVQGEKVRLGMCTGVMADYKCPPLPLCRAN